MNVYGKNDVKMELAKPAWTAEEGGDYERDEAEMAKAAQHPTKHAPTLDVIFCTHCIHSRRESSSHNFREWQVIVPSVSKHSFSFYHADYPYQRGASECQLWHWQRV
jgi:hypothetical protein